MMSIYDPIPVWTAWSRKMITMRAVSRQETQGRLAAPEFAARISTVQRRAQTTADMAVKTAAFWAMENLAATFLRQHEDAADFRAPALPLETRPIVHCGMGIAAVEVAQFRPERLAALIETVSNPDYRLFAYEGAGAMLAVYENDWFGLVARGVSALGLMHMAPMSRPEPEQFLRFFQPDIQKLMAHGYGRLLYFKSHDIGSAIRAAERRDYFDLGNCVQGIAFAYAMVNNSDLGRVFAAPAAVADGRLRAAFENGLVYALQFWEWMAPGFLRQFVLSTQAGSLGDRAVLAMSESRLRGVLPAFSVS
jgi:hypothetical protein